MNPTIVKIIDMMFRGIPETEETAAMREELLTNSQARYDDLIAAGETSDAALGQVLDNLRGMEDVLKECKTDTRHQEDNDPFARFERMAEEMENKWDDLTDKAETTAKGAFDSAMSGLRSAMSSVAGLFNSNTAQEKATDAQQWKTTDSNNTTATACSWQPGYDESTLSMAFAPGEISRINIQLTAEDIEVGPSPDGRVHLEISKADEDLYLVDVTAGCLGLRHRPFGSTAGLQQENEEYDGISGLFSGISKAVRSAIQSMRTSGDTLHILLPDHLEQITLQTASGDIDAENLRQKAVSLSTTSGDVDMTDSIFTGPVSLNSTSGDLELSHCIFEAPVVINTTSGDIEMRSNAPKLVLNTTSGDAEITGDVPEIIANTVSGDLEMQLTGSLSQIKANATSGDLTVTLPYAAAPTVHTHTVSGGVSITCATSDSAASTVSLSSVSGDLSVSNF